MITSDNLKFAFDNLSKEEVNNSMDSDTDYIAFEIHFSNGGGFSTAEPFEYTEESDELREEIEGNGNMVLDKDDFLMLFEESGSENPAFDEYI